MAEADDGLTIALSPVQLAAILAGESIGEDATITNRVWGTFRTLGGVLELVGAAALCLAPDPTLTTKVGCIFMGGHGSDTVATGLIQLYTGRGTSTLTETSTSKAAVALGADDKTAKAIALTVEVGVPALFTAMIGAARVGAIRGGRINLREHEAFHSAAKGGGHTIAKHVGKTEADMRARLANMVNKPKAVSSFRTLADAERAVSDVLRIHMFSVQNWAKSCSIGHGLTRLELVVDLQRFVGHGVVVSTGKLERMTKVVVVLRYQRHNNMPYYVVTAYPVP